MYETCDITHVEYGDFGLFGPINGEKLSETSLVSECPSEMLIKLNMLGGGGAVRDLKKVALKTKTLKEKIATTSASSMPSPKEFYTMADSNATSALETFGKRLNEQQLSEIVAILGGGASADVKMKEIGERLFGEKLQELKVICNGLRSTIENSSVVLQ